MKPLLRFFSVFILLLPGCNSETAEVLMKADRDFSNLSVETGLKNAFLEYADDTAVLLQKNSMPIIGKQAIKKSYRIYFQDAGMQQMRYGIS